MIKHGTPDEPQAIYRVTNPFDSIHATKDGETGVCIGIKGIALDIPIKVVGLHFEDGTEYWFFPEELTSL